MYLFVCAFAGVCTHLCLHVQVCIWCPFPSVSVCSCVVGVEWHWGREREPFGNNSGILLGIPCFPVLGTGCPSCNMITVTTAAITVATELQVNKGTEE